MECREQNTSMLKLREKTKTREHWNNGNGGSTMGTFQNHNFPIQVLHM